MKSKISLARRGDVLRMGSELSKYWNIYCRWAASVSIGKIYGIFLQTLSTRVRDTKQPREREAYNLYVYRRPQCADRSVRYERRG